MDIQSPVVRLAQDSDLERIIQLDEKLFRYDEQFDDTLDFNWSRSEEGIAFFKDRISGKNGIMIVSEINGAVIGYLAGAVSEPHSYRSIRSIAELECMFVEPAFRGYQVGSTLVNRFMSWVKEQGIDFIKIEASSGNNKAISFYKKLGFHEYNVILEQRLK